METAQAAQQAATTAQMLTPYGISWQGFLYVMTALWAVAGVLVGMVYRLLASAVNDGFKHNEASHAQIFALIRDQKEAIHSASDALDERCEARMESHGRRIGKLETDMSAIGARVNMRNNPTRKGDPQ